jgi:putative ABC transport system permease protein
MQDLRYAIRSLRRTPGVTLAAVGILAAGIGANTTVFSVVSALLLRSLPYPQPERLIALYEQRPAENMSRGNVSHADLLDWRAQAKSFSSMAAFEGTTFNFSGRGEPEVIHGAAVTWDFFETQGMRAMLGRTFTREHAKPQNRFAVVVTHSFWRRRLASDPNAPGQSIVLDARPYTILGVMPAEYVPPYRVHELFVPLQMNAEGANARTAHSLQVLGRLAPGVTIAEARAEMGVISKRIEAEHPEENKGHAVNVVPLWEAQRGEYKPAMILLLAAIALVLLIACLNVANLLLARALERSREILVRAALGAGRIRIARQFLLEGLLLGAAAAVAGWGIAAWGIEAVKAMFPADLALVLGTQDISLDTRVLSFTIAMAAASGLVFGLAPAIASSGASLTEGLRQAGRHATAGPERRRRHSVLAAAQVGLSTLLVIGAGLLIRTLWEISSVSPGFRPQGAVSMSFGLPFLGYADDTAKFRFQKALLDKVRAIPGVADAGIASFLPLSGMDPRCGFTIEGKPSDPRQPPRRAHPRYATAEYFSAMGIPLMRGRLFTGADTPETPTVMMINQTAARMYFDGEDPLGRRARNCISNDWAEIVGIVGDVKHWGLDREPRPEAYVSLNQRPFGTLSVVARSAMDPASLAPAMQQALWSIDPNLPATVRALESAVSESYAARRFLMRLLAAFAGLAMLLAAAGIFAHMAYSVTQRMSEFGIRMALGARRDNVMSLVLRRGMAPALGGAIAGLAGAFALTRLLQGFLFGISPLDAGSLAVGPVVMLAVAALACLRPALRATRIDPAVVLRHE